MLEYDLAGRPSSFASVPERQDKVGVWMERCAGLVEEACFIDWTSGTSGNPKGSLMWNKHLTNMLLWHLSQVTATYRNVPLSPARME